LERLRVANLLDLNKSISLPAAALRIGLITASGSAALADFTKTLLLSGFSFRISFVPATMQGETSPAQVINALHLLERQDIDVICLVRGGGSPLDLASFDKDNLGQAIARCHKPVWVGIGHEIDVTVPDFVAHTSHKTPTAVAVALVQRLQDLDARLATHQNRLEDTCQRRLMLADRELSRSLNGMRQGLRKHMQINETRFRAIEDRISRSIKNRLTSKQSRLVNHEVRLQERIGRVLVGKEQRLHQSLLALSRGTMSRLIAASKDIDQHAIEMQQLVRVVERRLASLDERQRYLDAVRPERILARGYSLTRDNSGNIIRDAAQIQPGQIIHTELSQGTITSLVKTISQDARDDQTKP
jgi:exodeoxyribonuclease VII large subunit